MLKRLVALVGSLVVAPLGVGCTKGDLRAKRRELAAKTFKVDFPMTKEQGREIRKGRDLGDRWAAFTFSDTPRFSRLDETVETNGYYTVTLGDEGEAYAGRFAMKATLRKGTGGPPGSATEPLVEVDDVRLVESLSSPKAPPGAKALLPGQIVVRKIAEGELAGLHDRYVIDLPAGKQVIVSLITWGKAYPFTVEVFKDDGELQVRDHNRSDHFINLLRDGESLPMRHNDISHLFETYEAGVHELRVRSMGLADNAPDSYRLYVFWGEGLSIGGPLYDHEARRKSPAAPGGSTTSEVKR